MLSRDQLVDIVRELTGELCTLLVEAKKNRDSLELLDKAHELLKEKSGYAGHIINCIENLDRQRDEALEISTNDSPKGSFVWALKQMKDGRKVRRHGRDYAVHIPWDDQLITAPSSIGPGGIPYELSVSDLEATDWELAQKEIGS